MPVSFGDLELAFDFVSDSGIGEHEAYLSRQTGKIYWKSDYSDDIEELPDDVDDAEKYLPIPNKRDLDLGKPLVLEFAHQFLPDDYQKVCEIFSRKGAYARFKDLLEYRGAVKQWQDFENSSTKDALRAWCEENGIELSD